MRIRTLTDERPGYLHPVPFVVLSLCGRNDVEFGRAGEMIYHQRWPVLRTGTASV
jgi:hypothetical protein